MAMRAMAGVQDANSFQEARDALLRYYYPVLRTLRKDDVHDPESLEITEDWAMELLHSPGKSSLSLFVEKVCMSGKSLSSEVIQAMQKCIDAARQKNDATPYERVGDVLSWLKENRRTHPELAWSHSALRQWMQGLLADFTLVDAKKQPGPLLDAPEQHYETMIASWESDKSGLPFNHTWKLSGQMWFTPQKDGGVKSFEMDQGRQGVAAWHLRAKLLQESPPGMALMTNTNLGVTRQFRPTWRDVTDYGVLHPLLTLDETSFDKNVWLDFIEHQGKKWSSPANERTWHDWQEAAQVSYQRILQAYTGSTPDALLYEVKHKSVNALELQAVSPLPLDWYKVVSDWSRRFPYLNQSPELEKLASLKLDATQLAAFHAESSQRVGQPLIQALMELPELLAGVDALNMPSWFHVRLQEEMRETTRLELPENLLDDDQTPSLH